MAHFPGQPMFLVPDTAIGAQRRERLLHAAAAILARPGRLQQQRSHMVAQTPNQGGQPRRQGRKASLPGTPGRKTPVLRQQGTNLARDGIVLFRKVQQGRARTELSNDHDDERLDKELIGIGFLAPALAFGGRRWCGDLLDKPQ